MTTKQSKSKTRYQGGGGVGGGNTSDTVFKGKIIPATVLEQKVAASERRYDYKRKLRSKLDPPLEKVHQCLLKCRLFPSCGSKSQERKQSQVVNEMTVTKQPPPSTTFDYSLSSCYSTSTPVYKRHPIMKQSEEIGLKKIGKLKRKLNTSVQTSPPPAHCITCYMNSLVINDNLNGNDDDDESDNIYECPECAEISLDVNNNFKKSFSSLTNNNQASSRQPIELCKKNSASKVTFASLFGGDLSIFDDQDRYNHSSSFVPSDDDDKSKREDEENSTPLPTLHDTKKFEIQSVSIEFNSASSCCCDSSSSSSESLQLDDEHDSDTFFIRL